MRAARGHNPKRRKFNKGSVKGQLEAFEQQLSVLQSNQGTHGVAAQNTSPSGTPLATNIPTNSETERTVISLPSLANEPDARLKGPEKLRDHLEEELLSQTKTQPEIPVQSELPELALSPSIINPTVSWTVMQTHVCWGNMHTSSWTMGKQLTLLDMIRARGSLQHENCSGAIAYDNQTSGKTVIIVVHQAIYVPTMDCNLICPMQVGMNDVKLDDKPKFLTEDPTNESHAISCEDNTGTQISPTSSERRPHPRREKKLIWRTLGTDD